MRNGLLGQNIGTINVCLQCKWLHFKEYRQWVLTCITLWNCSTGMFLMWVLPSDGAHPTLLIKMSSPRKCLSTFGIILLFCSHYAQNVWRFLQQPSHYWHPRSNPSTIPMFQRLISCIPVQWHLTFPSFWLSKNASLRNEKHFEDLLTMTIFL